MKIIRIILASIFSLILLVPVITFNFKPNAVSETDNRMLAESPFSPEVWGNGKFSDNFDKYVNDRIGLREEMIYAYTMLYDVFFSDMVHPMYTAGKNDYLFGSGITTNATVYSSFHERFALMVKEIQDYCEERNVPFLFVFNPAKPALYSENLPDGIVYSRKWVDSFFHRLDQLGINYLDNTKVLMEKKNAGEKVFNQKFDPNHWNYLGAYYGINAMLEELKKDIPTVHVNTFDDVTLSFEHKDSLLMAKYPINEDVPLITMNQSSQNIVDGYVDDIYLNQSYRQFGYYVNETRKNEGAPRALVFQGSYMNSYGKELTANAFSEYIHVHDYQNVIDFPYYYNAFQPDCVVFEVAEYTFMSTYFNFEKMSEIDYNPTLQSVMAEQSFANKSIDEIQIQITEGENLVRVTFNTKLNLDYAWLTLDKEYDLIKTAGGYSATVPKSAYTQYAETMKVYMQGDSYVCYS